MAESIPHTRFIVAGKLARQYILLPTGEVFEDVLGGSAVYGAAGVGLWEKGVAIVARTGQDFPEPWLNKIERASIDRRGVRCLPDVVDLREFIAYPDPETRVLENPVALYSQRGLEFPKNLLGYNRPTNQLDSRSRPSLLTIRQSDIPSDYLDAIAAHICPLDFLSHTLLPPTFRQGHINTITLDAGEGYMDPMFYDDMPVILSGLTAFFCNEEKLTRLFAGRSTDTWEMAEALAEMGCDLIVVKRRARGQFLYDRTSKTRWMIPAYPAQAYNLTGAGDAFCGGFLAGYRTSYDPLQATLCGNISASFAIEGSSPFYAIETMPGLASARLESLRSKVRRV